MRRSRFVDAAPLAAARCGAGLKLLSVFPVNAACMTVAYCCRMMGEVRPARLGKGDVRG